MSKKILMIAAHKNFRDEEYFIPRDVFLKSGFSVLTASSVLGEISGVFGGEALSDLKIEDIAVDDFVAVVFVGGAGASEFFENKSLHKIILDFFALGKVVGAICIAPVILAKSGVLDGMKATVWTSALDKMGKNILEESGCIFSGREVEIDGSIVTANGPEAAEEFAKKIVSLLSLA